MSGPIVTWPGGIGNPIGERIPTSDAPTRMQGGLGDTQVIPGYFGGRRSSTRRNSTRRNRKNRKQTRKNRKNRKYRASSRRLCGYSRRR